MAAAKLVIIGASGLLGRSFVRRLADLDSIHVDPEREVPVGSVVLFDLDVSWLEHEPLMHTKPNWAAQQGSLTDRGTLKALIKPGPGEDRVIVFLFAAVLSGNAEDNFALGIDVNLRAPLALLEEMKALGEKLDSPQTLVYTSSDYVACFNEENRRVPFSEEGFRLSPTSYGVQKACVELLISDFARRGFVDGRVGRISAMIGRPGFSNSVSSAFSMIFTQALIGKEYHVPLPMDVSLPCSSLENNVECLLLLAGKIGGDQLGHNRVVQLPARSVTLAEIWSATQRVAKRHEIALGRVTPADSSKADTTFKQINVVPRVNCQRSIDLGMPQDVDLEDIISNFIRREGLLEKKA